MHTSLAPTLSASFSVIAERFRRAGEIDRAVALCREGLEVFPDHLSARVTLGCALLDLGRHAEAHRELQAVLKRAPDNLLAIRGLAELHARGVDEQDAHDMQDAHDLQVAHDAQQVAEEAPIVAQPPVEPVAVAVAVEMPAALPVDAVEELDPLVVAAASFFELEDVIDDADDELGFADEPDARLDFDLTAGASGEFDFDAEPSEPMAPQLPADPIPVPTLSAGPIAVLDEWLTRIRARRSELLSEYAAS